MGFKPSESDKQWARQLVTYLKDNGVWIASSDGCGYRIDKSHQRLIRFTKDGTRLAELFNRRTIMVFNAIGWKVVDDIQPIENLA